MPCKKLNSAQHSKEWKSPYLTPTPNPQVQEPPSQTLQSSFQLLQLKTFSISVRRWTPQGFPGTWAKSFLLAQGMFTQTQSSRAHTISPTSTPCRKSDSSLKPWQGHPYSTPHPQLTPQSQHMAQLRNAMSIGEGSAMIFLQRPMSLTLLIIVAIVLVLPRIIKQLSRKQIDQTA